MHTYIIRRILIAVPLLLGLLTVNFFLIHAAPGDPTDIFYNPDMDPEARENLRRIYGLDQPLGVQYVRYVQGVLLEFEFGYSIAKKRPVRDEILDALPNTIQLSALALLIELTVGIAVGILAAVRQHSTFDNLTRVTALTFYSMPSFYLGLVLLFLFAGGISATHWLPASGMIDIVRYESMSGLEKIFDRIVHILLPALTLGVGGGCRHLPLHAGRIAGSHPPGLHPNGPGQGAQREGGGLQARIAQCPDPYHHHRGLEPALSL